MLLVAGSLSPAASALTTPEWFYSIEMPVKDQSQAERTRAAQQGLLAILSRVTGLASIPRTPEVNQALARTDRLYSEFVFVAPTASNESLRLRLAYQRDAILALIRQARLPLWWTRRPSILAWVVIEEGGERTILDASSEHPLVMALHADARKYGLELVLPLMDEVDQLAISPAEVWGNVPAAIDTASARYLPDIVLQGRLRSGLTFRGREAAGSWTYSWQGQSFGNNFSFNPGSPEVSAQEDALQLAAGRGLGPIVNELTQRYTILARGDYRWELRVSGLEAVGDYARMMRFLEGQDFIDQVEVNRAQQGVLTLTLNTRADATQLLDLLTLEANFAEDLLFRGRGVQLRWQS